MVSNSNCYALKGKICDSVTSIVYVRLLQQIITNSYHLLKGGNNLEMRRGGFYTHHF